MKYILILILFIQIYYVRSPIPSWELSSQSINLLSSKSSDSIILYNKEWGGLTAVLEKTFSKSDDGSITTKNKLTIDGKTLEVEFDAIDSHYKNKLDKEILVCPRGKFHPFDFKNENYVELFSNSNDIGDWDLRCYSHNEGCFFVFYLLKDGANLFYKYKNDIQQKGYIYSYLYDYKLENGSHDKSENYEYKFSLLRFQADNDNKYLILAPSVFIFNPDNGDVNFNTFNGNVQTYKIMYNAKKNTQAYFNENHKFYFFTYNDATDFESGFSNSYVNFNSKNEYENSIREMTLTTKSNSPLTFVDNVEIKELKLILESKYAYYKIYNKDKSKFYHGLIDIYNNKVVYNIEGDFKTFIPISTHEILAINDVSAYKICVIKSSNNGVDSCTDSCDGTNLLLDPSGNKCQSYCDTGKIKMMPEGICMEKNLCDKNIYEISSDEKECGLCSYFNSEGDIYKFINTEGCISTIPPNADYYNEKFNILKCKTNYHLDNGACIPDSCYDLCATCSEYGTEAEDQKCDTCKSGYILDQNKNCQVAPTTIVIPPTTVIIPPLQQL